MPDAEVKYVSDHIGTHDKECQKEWLLIEILDTLRPIDDTLGRFLEHAET